MLCPFLRSTLQDGHGHRVHPCARTHGIVASDLPREWARGNGYEVKYGKLHVYIRKRDFYGESGQAAEEVVQRGCTVSTLGDI